MKQEMKVMCIETIATMVSFTILAIYFNRWWLILFSIGWMMVSGILLIGMSQQEKTTYEYKEIRPKPVSKGTEEIIRKTRP